MENQHRQIKGYRDLSAQEIDLMNRIKAAGQALIDLQAEVAGRLRTDYELKHGSAKLSLTSAERAENINVQSSASPECQEFRRFEAAEPGRWAAIAKTDIQTGVMALVRAIAQPAV